MLSLAFDAAALRDRADVWAHGAALGALSAVVLGSVLGIALAGLLLNGRGTGVLRQGRPLDLTTLARLGLHLAGFAALYATSAQVFADQLDPARGLLSWAALWVSLAGFVALTAPWCATPRGEFWPLLRGALRLFPWGILIGGGAWLLGHGTARLWDPLGRWTLRAAGGLASLWLREVTILADEAVLASPDLEVFVAPECSGFEGLGLMTVFIAAYLALARRQLRFPGALLLLPAGLVAAWLANIARIALLFVIGARVSPDVAAGGFHAKAGWLFFCLVALAMVLLSRRSRWFGREVGRRDLAPALRHPTAAYLLPFMGTVAAALVAGIATHQVEWLYALRLLAGVPLLWIYRGDHSALLANWRRAGRWKVAWVIAAGGAIGLAYLTLGGASDPAALAAWQAEWETQPAGARAAWLALRVLGGVALVPVVEELAFRGYLLRRLLRPDFEALPTPAWSWPALLLSSAAFGAVHGDWLAGSFAGLGYGVLALRLGVWAAVVAHASSNLVLATLALAGERGLWL